MFANVFVYSNSAWIKVEIINPIMIENEKIKKCKLLINSLIKFKK